MSLCGLGIRVIVALLKEFGNVLSIFIVWKNLRSIGISSSLNWVVPKRARLPSHFLWLAVSLSLYPTDSMSILPPWCISPHQSLIIQSLVSSHPNTELNKSEVLDTDRFQIHCCRADQYRSQYAERSVHTSYLKNPQMLRRYWMVTTTTFSCAERASPS